MKASLGPDCPGPDCQGPICLDLFLLGFGPNCQALDMPRCQSDVVLHEESVFQVKSDEIGQLDQKN